MKNRTRKFNGVVYKYYSFTYTKNVAEKEKEKLKWKPGRLIRITKGKDRYELWIRDTKV